MAKKKTIGQLKKIAWAAMSLYVRRLYADRNGYCVCYTCNKPMHWKQEAQAGHAIDGRTNSVLFDLEILRPQCPGCNLFKNGNHKIFTTKLIKENGMEWWENKLTKSTDVVKYSRDDLESIKEFYAAKFSELQREWTL